MSNMKRFPVLIVGALGALCAPSFGQQQPGAGATVVAASAPGKATVARTATVRATVEAIDAANRQLTLKGPRGNVFAVAVDPQVRNLEQVKVGDSVVVRYFEALSLTLETGEVHYFSRSREKLWKKGETSGEIQKLVEIRTDCDQDALVVLVEQTGRGAACHTGRKTCFYRRVAVSDGEARLTPTGEPRLFDPAVVYKR